MALPPIKWTASPNYSGRGGVRVSMIVVHDCEGNYAGSIDWFTQKRSQVSAHLVLREDGAEATQMVAWSNKAWHACDANPMSEGIEAAGFAAKGLGAPELQTLADLVAWRLHENGLPCQEATAANGWRGFTEHAKLGTWGGGHHDFTETTAVWSAFVKLVQSSYAGAPATVAPPIPAPAPPAPPGFVPNPKPRIDPAEDKARRAAAAADFETAVKNFQQALGLTVDGDPGAATRSAFLTALAA